VVVLLLLLSFFLFNRPIFGVILYFGLGLPKVTLLWHCGAGCLSGVVAQRFVIGLAITRSWLRLAVKATLGTVVHTLVPLSPSSI